MPDGFELMGIEPTVQGSAVFDAVCAYDDYSESHDADSQAMREAVSAALVRIYDAISYRWEATSDGR